MPRLKKDSHPVCFKMETDIYNRLKDYCERSGQPLTTAVERAVSKYMDEYDDMISSYEGKKENGSGVK